MSLVIAPWLGKLRCISSHPSQKRKRQSPCRFLLSQSPKPNRRQPATPNHTVLHCCAPQRTVTSSIMSLCASTYHHKFHRVIVCPTYRRKLHYVVVCPTYRRKLHYVVAYLTALQAFPWHFVRRSAACIKQHRALHRVSSQQRRSQPTAKFKKTAVSLPFFVFTSVSHKNFPPRQDNSQIAYIHESFSILPPSVATPDSSFARPCVDNSIIFQIRPLINIRYIYSFQRIIFHTRLSS